MVYATRKVVLVLISGSWNLWTETAYHHFGFEMCLLSPTHYVCNTKDTLVMAGSQLTAACDGLFSSPSCQWDGKELRTEWAQEWFREKVSQWETVIEPGLFKAKRWSLRVVYLENNIWIPKSCIVSSVFIVVLGRADCRCRLLNTAHTQKVYDPRTRAEIMYTHKQYKQDFYDYDAPDLSRNTIPI